jgi:hypothetical protein
MSTPDFPSRAAVIGLLVVLGQAVGSPALAQASSCLAADDTSARIVHFLAILLTDTSHAGAAERDTVGLNRVAPGQIAPVSDSGTCDKIVAALNRFEGVERPNRKVYAYSLGPSHYAVQDPHLHSGEWTPVFLLDRAFTIIRPYLAF